MGPPRLAPFVRPPRLRRGLATGPMALTHRLPRAPRTLRATRMPFPATSPRSSRCLSGPAARRRLWIAYAPARCCWGVMPRTRLNAVLRAKELPYPTCRATESTVAPGSRSRSAARVRRQVVRNVIGGSPTSSLKRRARAAREIPVAEASVATVHGRLGSLCSNCRAGPTTGPLWAWYHPGASASGRTNQASLMPGAPILPAGRIGSRGDLRRKA